MKPRWAFTFLIALVASAAYDANVLATPSSGVTTTILAKSLFDEFNVKAHTVPADTWLCTYHGPASEGLRNDEAQRRVDMPETRAELLQLFGGEDDDDFREYLADNCYDLHYAAVPQARPHVSV